MQTIPACMLLIGDELEVEDGAVIITSVVEDMLAETITIIGTRPSGKFIGEYGEWDSVNIYNDTINK